MQAARRILAYQAARDTAEAVIARETRAATSGPGVDAQGGMSDPGAGGRTAVSITIYQADGYPPVRGTVLGPPQQGQAAQRAIIPLSKR